MGDANVNIAMHFLGLDIGTSAAKAALVDERQAVVAQAAAPIATHNPRPGWSEQDPEDWWRATETVVTALRQLAPAAFADVRAIGLSGQMHGAVVLDAAGRLLRPAILWNDGRATAECATLAAAVPRLAEIAGVIAMPGFTAPKVLWLRTHEPDAFTRIAHVVLAKDYVRLRLTGEIATDVSDAAQCARFVAEVAALTIEAGSSVIAVCHATQSNVLRLLQAWSHERERMCEVFSRPDWLLDGWKTICALWHEAQSGDREQQRAAVLEIERMVPVMPKEVAEWTGTENRKEGNVWSQRRWVKAHEDWRKNVNSLDLKARNELIRAYAA